MASLKFKERARYRLNLSEKEYRVIQSLLMHVGGSHVVYKLINDLEIEDIDHDVVDLHTGKCLELRLKERE